VSIHKTGPIDIAYWLLRYAASLLLLIWFVQLWDWWLSPTFYAGFALELAVLAVFATVRQHRILHSWRGSLSVFESAFVWVVALEVGLKSAELNWHLAQGTLTIAALVVLIVLYLVYKRHRRKSEESAAPVN
jgi:membrane protein implicated in regulation of membrane protease activity